MKKQKITLVIGLIIGLAAAFFYYNFSASRYEIKKDGTSIVKVDKWTGKSWSFVNNNWKIIRENYEEQDEVEKTLIKALGLTVAQVDTEAALKKLKENYPLLRDIPNDELLERINLVYSKKVIANMYLSDFLNK
jgi:hypothetical protein